MTWEQTIKEYAKDAFEEGRQKGLEDGLKRGLEDGLKKGLEEGRQDGIKEGVKETARNNAISLLNKTQLSPEMIADCCALTPEEVLELKQSLQAEPVNS